MKAKQKYFYAQINNFLVFLHYAPNSMHYSYYQKYPVTLEWYFISMHDYSIRVL